jgi:tetratricopeptide repeat protein 21B
MADPQKALKEFNTARFDQFYGSKSLLQMIEIYLNPNNELLWSSSGENTSTTSAENIKAAESLIQELNARDFDTTILECYAFIHTKKKELIEKAMNRLTEILQKNKEFVPALVAMATAKLLMKK